MSKIKNCGLDQYGAELFEQQQFRTDGLTTRFRPPLLVVVDAELVLDKWRTAVSDKCPCGQPQTMNDIVQFCKLTKLLHATNAHVDSHRQ